jgi:hypothetical protein
MRKLLFVLLLVPCLSAAIGDNAPAVPSTWVLGHPRLGAPTNAQLLAIYNGGSLPARFVAAANVFDNCVTPAYCFSAAAMPTFRYLMLAVRAYEVGHAGGCNVAPCTAWMAKLQAMQDMGAVWGTVQFKDDGATGDGAGHVTLTTGGLSFLTGCGGGSCANYALVYLGLRYTISATGLTATTATITKTFAGDGPIPFPNGSGLKVRVLSNTSLNTGPAILFSVLYDWFYQDWTPQQRSDMATALANWCLQMENQFTNAQEYAYNDQFYCNGAASWEGCLAEFLPAMAIYPDLGSTGLAHLRWTMDLLLNITLPVWKQVQYEGGWHDDWTDYEVGSGNFGKHAWVVPAFLAWANASGRGPAFFTADYPWLKNWAYWTMYLTKPDFLMEKAGSTITPILIPETSYQSGGYAGYDSMEGLGEIYNDPTIRGWARLIEGNPSPDGFEPSAFPWFTPDNASNTVTNPGGDPRVNLPLCRVFNGVGWMVCKSAWSELGTHAFFKFGENFWSHAIGDAGHFTLYSHGNMAITSGTYISGSSSRQMSEYYTQTVSKNLLTVTDTADTGYPNQWISPLLPNGTYSCEAPPNDGGQRRVGVWAQIWTNNPGCSMPLVNTYTNKPYDYSAWMRGREFFHRVNLLAAVCSPSPCGSTLNYAYLAVDLTAAYNNGLSGSSTQTGYGYSNRSQRVQRYVRHFVFIPDGNAGYLVIFDATTSTNSGFKKTWRLHTINQPTISSNQYTVLRQEKATNSPYGLCPAFAYNAGLLTGCSAAAGTYQYNGKMVGFMVFPSGGSLCNLGGSGHEFDDGSGTGSACATGTNRNECQGPPGSTNCGTANYGLGTTQDYANPQSSAGVVEAGSWRLEESPATSNPTDYFLNVIRVGDAAGTFPAAVSGTTAGSGQAATHTATWTNSNCTYTITFNDFGVGGSAAATGSGCAHSF